MTTTRVSIGDWPRLTRFYGLTPEEIGRMPNNILAIYADQLDPLSAEESMEATIVAMVPHVVESERKKLWRDWGRRAGLVGQESIALDVRSDGGKRALAGLGIGVRIESSEEEDNDA